MRKLDARNSVETRVIVAKSSLVYSVAEPGKVWSLGKPFCGPRNTLLFASDGGEAQLAYQWRFANEPGQGLVLPGWWLCHCVYFCDMCLLSPVNGEGKPYAAAVFFALGGSMGFFVSSGQVR